MEIQILFGNMALSVYRIAIFLLFLLALYLFVKKRKKPAYAFGVVALILFMLSFMSSTAPKIKITPSTVNSSYLTDIQEQKKPIETNQLIEKKDMDDFKKNTKEYSEEQREEVNSKSWANKI
jgi:predicted membrane protein